MQAMGCHQYSTHALSATCFCSHLSSEQPIGIVVTLEACLKLHLTNQALISIGVNECEISDDLISA